MLKNIPNTICSTVFNVQKPLLRTLSKGFGTHWEGKNSIFTERKKQHMSDQTKPMTTGEYINQTLERNEIEARIYKVVRDFENLNVRDFRIHHHIEKDMKLDSLDRVKNVNIIELKKNIYI